MKKISIILALALAVVMVMGISTAFAAGVDPATTSGELSVYGDSYAKYTPSVGDATYMVPGTVNDPFGSSAKNANGTGLDNLRKTVTGQAVHGSYKTNSNSCASCHITHNAPGAKLLFKSTVYNTCTTCHDGTLGYLNVFQTGAQLKDQLSTGGLYDVDKMYKAGAGTFRFEDAKGASMHMANGAVKNNAAPGGNKNSSDSKSWGAEFTCASCHAPHGSYSTRLLHYNANNVGLRANTDGGNFKSGVTEITYSTNKYVYSGDTTTPWLYGYTYGSPKAYWTKIYVDADNNGIDADDWKYSATKAWNDVLKINYKGAYFEDPDALIPEGRTITMDIAPAVVSKFEATGTGENTVITGYGATRNTVSKFCAACHTEYNTNSNSGSEKVFSDSVAAHRHTINRGATDGIPASVGGTGLECLSCHYAHGTNQDIQLEADNTFATTADINPSSALKRYVNQGVCVRCHTSSSASTLKNSDGYWDGDMANKILPQLH